MEKQRAKSTAACSNVKEEGGGENRPFLIFGFAPRRHLHRRISRGRDGRGKGRESASESYMYTYTKGQWLPF